MNDVAEIKVGNKLVFEEVYNSYHERFYFYVLKNTSSEELAEEVVQMAFIKIWKKGLDYPTINPLKCRLHAWPDRS